MRRSLSVTSNTSSDASKSSSQNVLRVEYAATTNRMLRVSVNGFFESVGVVLEVMEQLDVDVVGLHDGEVDLKGVQGLTGVPG